MKLNRFAKLASGALLLCCLSPELRAEIVDIPVTYNPPKDTTDRPRIPSRDRILFHYDTDTKICFVDFPENVISMSVIIEDANGESHYNILSADNNFWCVDIPKGMGHITCTTETGKEYEAYFEIG